MFLRYLGAKLPWRKTGPAYQFEMRFGLSTIACRKSVKGRLVFQMVMPGLLMVPRKSALVWCERDLSLSLSSLMILINGLERISIRLTSCSSIS